MPTNPVVSSGRSLYFIQDEVSAATLAAAKKTLEEIMVDRPDFYLRRLANEEVRELAALSKPRSDAQLVRIDQIISKASRRKPPLVVLLTEQNVIGKSREQASLDREAAARAQPETRAPQGRHIVGEEATQWRRESLKKFLRQDTRNGFTEKQIAAVDTLDDLRVRELLRASTQKNEWFGDAHRLPELLERYTGAGTRLTERLRANPAGASAENAIEKAIEPSRSLLKISATSPVAPTPLAPATTSGVSLAKAAKVAGRVVRVGGGVLAVAGGAVQAAEGVKQISEGKTATGVTNVGIGAGGAVGGVLIAAGASAAGAAIGGVVAIVDGAKDVVQGVQAKDNEKISVGATKAVAGGAMVAGLATANPALIAGGAIVYGGALVYENRRAIAEGAGAAASWVKRWF